jgi:uncharacterized protein (DUF2249 family)
MITKDLKISKMLAQYPQTLEVLLNASPHFKKLNNKFLRKSLAGRVNVEQAARIAGVSLNELLLSLNLAIGEKERIQASPNDDKDIFDNLTMVTETGVEGLPNNISNKKIIELDVRPIIDSGSDPFKDIMTRVKNLKEDETLMILNTFEPVPLYSVLGKKGYGHQTIRKNGEWIIYFFKDNTLSSDNETGKKRKPVFNEEIFELDVRNLEPPEPMVKILETLTKLSDNTILLVHHHREPLMLYDKLAERGYSAITNKIEENYYKVLITKNKNV